MFTSAASIDQGVNRLVSQADTTGDGLITKEELKLGKDK